MVAIALVHSSLVNPSVKQSTQYAQGSVLRPPLIILYTLTTSILNLQPHQPVLFLIQSSTPLSTASLKYKFYESTVHFLHYYIAR